MVVVEHGWLVEQEQKAGYPLPEVLPGDAGGDVAEEEPDLQGELKFLLVEWDLAGASQRVDMQCRGGELLAGGWAGRERGRCE